MIRSILGLFRRAPSADRPPAPDGYAALNRRAPLRNDADTAEDKPATEGTVLCREAILGRDQRVAGYRFMLREGTRNRIRRSSRVVHHVYAEVLIATLMQDDIGKLLGHRLAFVEIPDSFLDHPSLLRLPPANTVVTLHALDDDDAPSPDDLLSRAKGLRVAGYRVAIEVRASGALPAYLLPEVDFVILQSGQIDPAVARDIADRLAHDAPHAALVATDLATLDEFGFYHALGAACFHGAFITSREDWQDRQLGPDLAQARVLFDALQHDAPTSEIIALTKQNPALALRLLRHVNSAAAGADGKIESIEHALQIVGRGQLSRWVMLVLFNHRLAGGRSPAALETALVRARMVELLGSRGGAGNPERLFLTGLLSLVDLVLQVPLQRALAELAVAPDIVEAIAEGSGPLAAPLALAIACERADTEGIERLASECGVSAEVAGQLYMKALWWALDVNL